MGAKGKGKGKAMGKSETRYCYDCGEQGQIEVNCPYKWANSMDEEDEQVSSWESEPEGEKAEELASLERSKTKKESGAGLRRAKSPDGAGRLIRDQHSTTSLKTMKVSKRPED